SCRLVVVAQMPLEVQDSLLTVPAGINGHWVRLVVDTGAERSVVSKALAERLRLEPDRRYTTSSLGVGGMTTAADVRLDGLVLGGVRFPIGRMAVGGFHLHTAGGLDADGLLGADVLLGFDMDIDVPGGRLTLYRARHCADQRPPWADPVEITGASVRRDRLLLPVELDGIAGQAFLDTGAQRNVIGGDLARRLGLTERAMAADQLVRQRGVGPREVIAHLHRFALLRVGPVAQAAPEITVLSADAGFGDALVGEEFLQGRRAWISFRNRRVFVTRRSGER
ncbi:MAG TPA: aspartyl protease family protein, partial [Rhodopila sp.]|nr:aspartyl protease family protein [Rhodopila sp.]